MLKTYSLNFIANSSGLLFSLAQFEVSRVDSG